MITIQQIRGARGILGWTQLALAEQCGLSKTAINNLERGLVNPRVSTLKLLTRKFEEHGIEFQGDYGVNLRQEIFKVEVFEGRDSFPRLIQDVIDTTLQTRVMPVHFNINDQIVLDAGYEDVYYDYFKTLQEHRITEKVLLQEGDMVRYAPYTTSSYRWMAKDLATQIGYSVYGNKYAIFTIEKQSRAIIIESPSISEVYRQQFESTWAQARPQPKVTPLFDKYEKK